MIKSKPKRIFVSISLLLLIVIIACLVKPIIIINLYKSLYVKYVRIAKSDFTRRFSKAELNTAIFHASQQEWVQSQIAADLAPFKHGISHAQIEYWFKTLQHDSQNKLAKFKVINNTVQVEVPSEFTKSRQYKTVYSIISMLASNHHIPDCEFIVALNDYLSYVPQGTTEPAAIFSFAKHTQIPVERTTILIPDWMNVRYWDLLRSRIDLASRLYPWNSKKNLIHWRGGCADSMQHRTRLVNLKNKFDFLDVGMTEGQNRVPYVDPEFSVQYKYQIALDGARCTWERMVWQMYSNTVLIKPNSPQVQWFHRGLKAYYNYVPIADLDEEKILFVYNWLQHHDLAAQEIASNANRFARDNFKTQDFFAYYAVLLQEYAKLMNT